MRSELELALEDEGICDRIMDDGNCPRWVTITAFYAALRFVNHYIFPFTLSSIEEGVPDTEANSIDEYLHLTGDDAGRHGARVLILRYKLKQQGETSRIARKYSKLMNVSQTARYSTEEVGTVDAENARRWLEEIKAFCAPGQTQEVANANDEVQAADGQEAQPEPRA